MKKFCTLLVVTILTLGFSHVLMVWANPEVLFWKEYRDKNSERLQQLRTNHVNSPVVLVTGGSSCSFSIDPLVVEERLGMPVCNKGGSASMGASYLIASTLQEAKSGDILVLALEPGLLSKFIELETVPLALEMGVIQGQPTLSVGRPIIDRDLEVKEVISTLRPGSRYFSTMLSKLITRRPLYRYTMNGWQDGGRLSTDYKDTLLQPNERMERPFPISLEGASILKQTAIYCKENGISIYYALPWIYTKDSAADINRQFNERFLDEVEKILPVLRDQRAGVCTQGHLFADTSYHLSYEGAGIRSAELAEALLSALTSK